MTEVKQVYRFLLRTVRDRITSRRQNPIWHDFIVGQFHGNSTERDPAKVQELLQIAKDYAQLVQDVHYEKVSDQQRFQLGESFSTCDVSRDVIGSHHQPACS
jgi:hypothetical protein